MEEKQELFSEKKVKRNGYGSYSEPNKAAASSSKAGITEKN